MILVNGRPLYLDPTGKDMPAIRKGQFETYFQEKLGHFAQEQLWVASLNVQSELIDFGPVLFGGLAYIDFRTYREIIQRPFVANAASFIVVHNHPSGNLMPSKNDIDFAKKLRIASTAIGLPMVDSIIVTQTHSQSLLRGGLLD